jgi:3-dehydroquinate synthase
VPIAGRHYDVHLGDITAHDAAGKLARALGGSTGVAVLVDGGLAGHARVSALIGALEQQLPRVRRYDLAPGEACKTFSAVEATCQWMASQGYDRGSAVVGVGGGAASDHAGFAAAVYLRGVPFAICPTTLLAMVDASVGGKTGIDLEAGKNLVGAFHQPRVVVADLGFLDSLPARERTAGMAEVVKAGLIGDAALFDDIERTAVPLSRDIIGDMIARAVRVKVEVVTADERESHRRAVLNFGHTVGHALEAASQFSLLHGEAVSLGMVAALALGASLGVTDRALPARASALLDRLGLPVDVGRRLSPDVLGRIDVDKKRLGDAVHFVFVPRVGEAVMRDIPLADLKAQVRGLYS